MANQAQVTARVVSGRSPSRWKLSRCTSVTTSVTVVNTNTAGTAMRAPDHRAARAAPTSSPRPHRALEPAGVRRGADDEEQPGGGDDLGRALVEVRDLDLGERVVDRGTADDGHPVDDVDVVCASDLLDQVVGHALHQARATDE